MPLAAGSKLGPYEILAPIGAGGMGEVYRALDPRLQRVVAIKVLRDAHRLRFEREARTVAALAHPHICTVYDVGPDYMVMEFIEGAPLHGPVAVEEALTLATQIASALEAAHERGIIHRDLKPGNILVAKSGVKLLDFGLAKVPEAPNPDVTVTEAGAIVGTAAYMSPEQAKGRSADARSDIFSFGVVLYELLSGRRPFEGQTALEVMAAIVYQAPSKLGAPAAVERIIARCLAKDPAERFQTAAELKSALEAARGVSLRSTQSMQAGTALPPSIAVLPFANMSGDKQNEYFSDGLAEEILNLLTRVRGLKVIARTSSFAFRGKEQDIRQIAQVLGVTTILEGSVRRAGSRVRVTAQLIKAEDGSHLWSERYDREMVDVFAVQDEMAAAIAGALQLKFSAKVRHTPNLAAHEAYLKGASFVNTQSPEGLARAKECFERAIELDPEYAEPRAGLGGCYFWLSQHGSLPPHEAAPLARAALERALEIDPSSALAHACLAGVARVYDYDWARAERHIQLARSEEGFPAEVHFWACLHYLGLGKLSEAVKEAEKSVETDPLDVYMRVGFAFALYAAREYGRALGEARRALEMDRNYWLAHSAVALIRLAEGRVAEAVAAVELTHQTAPWSARITGILAGLMIRAGNWARAEELLGQLRALPTARIAIGMLLYHAITGEMDSAAAWFEQAVEHRDQMLTIYIWYPLLDGLRASGHWARLAAMIHLPAMESR